VGVGGVGLHGLGGEPDGIEHETLRDGTEDNPMGGMRGRRERRGRGRGEERGEEEN